MCFPHKAGTRGIQTASSIGVAALYPSAAHLSSNCPAPDWRSAGRAQLERQGDPTPALLYKFFVPGEPLHEVVIIYCKSVSA